MLRRAFTLTVLILPALFVHHALGGHLIGSTFSGAEGTLLYDLDPATGLSSNPRPTGLDRVAGLALLPDGTLLGLTTSGSATQPNALFAIDPDTGNSTLVGATGLAGITEGDLACDPDTGALYGLYDVQQGARKLFTLDRSTGQATALSGALPGDPSAMAFDSDGTLHVLDTSLQTVMTVDPATGSASSSLALSTSLGATAGMAFDPASEIMYVVDGESGGHDSLFTLNATTGELIFIGSTGVDGGFSGLVWIPEPASALMLMAAASLVRGRRQVSARHN